MMTPFSRQVFAEHSTWFVSFVLVKAVMAIVKDLSKLIFQSRILCRSRQNVLTTSWSDDNGNSWSPLEPTTIPNPNAGTDAVTLQDGRQLLVYNHTTRSTGNRGMLNIALSADGVDWTPVMTLEKARGEYSYPAVIQTRDGLVNVTYTYQRKSVKHVVIDPRKLPK